MAVRFFPAEINPPLCSFGFFCFNSVSEAGFNLRPQFTFFIVVGERIFSQNSCMVWPDLLLDTGEQNHFETDL